MSQVISLCHQHPPLLVTHRPQLHTLLGLYAMSMNCMEAAEAQFTAALRYVLSDVEGVWKETYHLESWKPLKMCQNLSLSSEKLLTYFCFSNFFFLSSKGAHSTNLCHAEIDI